MRPGFWLCLIAGALGSQVFLWCSSLPLGVPGEWVWQRVAPEPDAAWNLLGIAVAVVLYLAFVEVGGRQLSRRGAASSTRVYAWLAGLVAVSFAWLWVVQESAPIRNRLGKSAFVLYYPSSSGYFTKARYEDADVPEFLSGYADLMRERDVLHVGTHPPGLFLIFHGLIRTCEQVPGVAAILAATQPSSFREACDVIARNSLRSVPPRLLLVGDRQVLWLATLLVMLSASLSVLPLYALMRRTHDAAAAWWTAALWPSIPALAVFTPKSDVAYAFVGLLMVLAWLTAVDRRSVLLSTLAGLIVWCGLMMSLAFLPVILFLVIAGWQSRRIRVSESEDVTVRGASSWMRGVPPGRCIVGALVGFLLPTLLMGWGCGINLFDVWWLNYQNHAAFYAKYVRTGWQWRLVNPVELAFAAGWPVALLALVAGASTIRRRDWSAIPAAAVLIVWGALWLSGKNSGEAARLWIVFLPWLVWMGGRTLSDLNDAMTRRWFRPSLVVLAIQFLVGACTVARVSGFEI